MWFTDSETRVRHAFIDNSLNNTAEILANEACVRRLGEVSVANAQFMISRSLVPNVRHGEVKIPRGEAKQDSEHIPVIALRPGEAVAVKGSMISPTLTQLHRAAERASAWYPDQTTHEIMSRIDSEVKLKDNMVLSYQPSSVAYVLSREHRFQIPNGNGRNPHRYMRMRPFMNLQMSDDNHTRMDPSAVLHEAIHLEQALLNPLQRYDSREDEQDTKYRRELEAYHRQMYFIQALADIGYEAGEGERSSYIIESSGARSSAAAIDNVREATNRKRKDPFFPNGTLKKLLDEKGLDIVGSSSKS